MSGATFSSDGKMMSFRVLPEIYHSMHLDISDINQAGHLKFQDRNITKEVYLNAVLVAYLSRERHFRRRIMETTLKVVENMLASRTGIPVEDEARINLPAYLEIDDANFADQPDKDE